MEPRGVRVRTGRCWAKHLAKDGVSVWLRQTDTPSLETSLERRAPAQAGEAGVIAVGGDELAARLDCQRSEVSVRDQVAPRWRLATQDTDVNQEHRGDPSDRAAPRCRRDQRQAGVRAPRRSAAAGGAVDGLDGDVLAAPARLAPAAPSASCGPRPQRA